MIELENFKDNNVLVKILDENRYLYELKCNKCGDRMIAKNQVIEKETQYFLHVCRGCKLEKYLDGIFPTIVNC